MKHLYSQSQMKQLKNLWRRSTSENIHLNQGSSGTRRGTRHSSRRIRRTLLHPHNKRTQHEMMRKLKNDFWSITGIFVHRHLVEPRVKLYVPRAESCPILLKYIDVTRTTDATLDVMLESSTDDYWNIDGDKELSDAWTGFTRFILLNERPLDGYTWSGERLTRKQTTSRPDKLWPEMWNHMV